MVLAVLGGMVLTFNAYGQPACDALVTFLSDRAVDVVCFESEDLTTNNEDPPRPMPTTPPDNSIAGRPAFAFTPRTDRTVISPDPPDRTPISRAVPGIQVQGFFADDSRREARFVLRFPNDWNGRAVVGGASGTRSEYNGDFAWSDYVLQEGYAYASQNKGILNIFLSTAADPLACRLNPDSTIYAHPYALGPETAVRPERIRTHYGRPPQYTYAVGTSNGGYQVRRAIENAPELFSGGIDWEGTYMRNLLIDLPPAIRNIPDYVASGYDPDSQAARNIRAAGYPPDIFNATGMSLWKLYSDSYWEYTQCLFQKAWDFTYDTYGAGAGNYDFHQRAEITAVDERISHVQTSGQIKRPLITLAGTLDALLPIQRHARVYAETVRRHLREGEHENAPQYRLYEIQNGNHIEFYKNRPGIAFGQLEFIQPHAQHAFDLLVNHVEHHVRLPPDQCVPRGGSIADHPSERGHCSRLLVP
jgi:hypothetical protein